MKNEMFVKIRNDASSKRVKKLINVCAWCPKSSYPKLEEYEDYTHGLCEKHYQLLKTSKV